MLLERAALAIALVVLMELLVVLQMQYAAKDKLLTVEQLLARPPGERMGMSFDRHYGMPLDVAVIAPFTGLLIFLYSPQWNVLEGWYAAIITIVFTGICLWTWSRSPTLEPHKIPRMAGWLHGLFFAIAMWAFLMASVFTPRPEPVLLLLMSIVLPAFLFVGTHLYLGLIDWAGKGALSSYPDKHLKNPVDWAVFVLASLAMAWRSYVLIPESFWNGLQ